MTWKEHISVIFMWNDNQPKLSWTLVPSSDNSPFNITFFSNPGVVHRLQVHDVLSKLFLWKILSQLPPSHSASEAGWGVDMVLCRACRHLTVRPMTQSGLFFTSPQGVSHWRKSTVWHYFKVFSVSMTKWTETLETSTVTEKKSFLLG